MYPIIGDISLAKMLRKEEKSDVYVFDLYTLSLKDRWLQILVRRVIPVLSGL